MTPKRLFIVMIVALLLVIGASGGIFYITRGQLVSSIDQIAEAEAQLQAADLEQEILTKTQMDIQNFNDQGIDLDAQLPSSKSQRDAIERVVDIFERNNIPVSSVSFLPTEGLPSETSQTEVNPISSIFNIPIEISTGKSSVTYSEFRNFLNDLEHSERHLNVRGLTVSSVGNNRVSYSVNLVVHFLLENQAQEGELDKAALLEKLSQLEAEEN